jgi:CRP/FNR family transcriptional regulator, cyclic AMP receptor protein
MLTYSASSLNGLSRRSNLEVAIKTLETVQFSRVICGGTYPHQIVILPNASLGRKSEREMYFLLAGKAMVIVNGVRLYPREPGLTVGEISAVNSQIKRSATIEAMEPTVAWKVSHAQLEQAATVYPRIWQLLARDIAGRLEQRNKLINRTNLKPRVFIICSAEALDIAETIRIGLDHINAHVVIWSDEQIFPPGSYPLDDLETQVNIADFGITIAQPDDLIRSRDKTAITPRDNVIFELGFFMSRLGRARTLLLVPRGKDLKLPSDFKGMTPIEYKPEEPGVDQSVTLATAVDRIKKIIRKAGVRSSFFQTR